MICLPSPWKRPSSTVADSSPRAIAMVTLAKKKCPVLSVCFSSPPLSRAQWRAPIGQQSRRAANAGQKNALSPKRRKKATARWSATRRLRPVLLLTGCRERFPTPLHSPRAKRPRPGGSPLSFPRVAVKHKISPSSTAPVNPD